MLGKATNSVQQCDTAIRTSFFNKKLSDRNKDRTGNIEALQSVAAKPNGSIKVSLIRWPTGRSRSTKASRYVLY